MILHGHSDVSYLNKPDARSRLGGYWFLSKKPLDPTKSDTRSNHVFAGVHEITGKIATDQNGFILISIQQWQQLFTHCP